MDGNIRGQTKDYAMNLTTATDSTETTKPDIKKVRRRIEDALRKTATREQLMAIAQMLGVKIDT
jgi:hypothetical protein